VAPTAPAIATIRPSSDSDDDGVSSRYDQCPQTQRGIAVDDRGCAIFSGVLQGVTFHSASAELTPQAKQVLLNAASTLNRWPSVKVSVAAHTDNQGNAQANLQLSKQRAIAVAKFLVSAGVDKNRFKVRAYGESRPIAPNDSAQGRRTNRRVELTALSS